jgi:hypothetical protein
LLEYDNGRYERLLHAPKSYSRVRKVVFCVDDEGFLERLHGVWVEQPGEIGRKWLFVLELRKVFHAMLKRTNWCDVLVPPTGVNGTISEKLGSYLANARAKLRDEHNLNVLGTAYFEMNKAGEFALLNQYGDSLDKPPQW